ncbi:hypothetical protein SAMN05216556_12423 [Aequorivita viscosa]|uniref:Uncharacterized protein n=1 Tax=Aequorivita viscosa TaxID=797419 RepID=A0A1M6M336_9FLAO|nr:hypothetical protein SAMN05216556_12423 [Aequorivita viscosa]SHJ77849.1 hypothetical protein SAMN04487908_12537 [Aequorivita viscosa]
MGSSSYITNLAGEINEHTCPELGRRVEYLPFGEIEERDSTSPIKNIKVELNASRGAFEQ